MDSGHRTTRKPRPWPEGVQKKGAFRAFVEAYRAAFDADPDATFCAGELDGLTVVVAVGEIGQRLQEFVELDLGGVIERRKEPTS